MKGENVELKERIDCIERRKKVVAETYASLIRWAKVTYDMPADTPEDISMFYKLNQSVYPLAVQAGAATVVAEYRGLETAQSFLEG